MIATDRNDYDMVNFLVAQGAEINDYNTVLNTAIMPAAEKGCTRIFDLLVERGVDVYSYDDRFEDSLMFAVSNGQIEIVERILDIYKKDGKLEYINDGNKNDLTPLMMAAANGRIDLVKLLLDNGADLHARTTHSATPDDEFTASGNTSLHYAALNGHAEMVKLLLSEGADPNMGNNHGTTALMCAAKHGNLDTLELILGCLDSSDERVTNP